MTTTYCTKCGKQLGTANHCYNCQAYFVPSNLETTVTDKDKRIAELEAEVDAWKVKNDTLAWPKIAQERDQLRELCREMRDALNIEMQFLTMRGMLPLDKNHHILKALEKADTILRDDNE